MSVPLCVQSLSASPLFSSTPLLRPAAAAGPKREPSRESQHRGAAFSLLPALAIGNEAQGELQPPLLIWQGCVLLGI